MLSKSVRSIRGAALGPEGLPARVPVGFFPLLIDGDGAPVRAVAFLDEGV